jgi:predicted ATP-grasp superfamily ATP-dependent carboligase
MFRLSATMDLYTDYQLFKKHMAAGNGEMVEFEQDFTKSHAQYVIYAEHAMTIKGDIVWPAWVYDRPVAGSFLTAGMPVCTVVAEAETAEQAKYLVLERAVLMTREF